MRNRLRPAYLLVPLLMLASGCADRPSPVAPPDTVLFSVQEGAAIVVNSLADLGVGGCTTAGDGDGCTLREAIAAVADGGTITFAPGLSGTISLIGSELSITRPVAIQGPGAAEIAVNGQSAWRAFNIVGAGTVSISGLTLVNGSAHAGTSGGCVQNLGSAVTLTHLVVTNCFADGAGGGISNSAGGTLTVIESTVSGNRASNGGGGIYNDHNATLAVTASTVMFNEGREGGGIGSTGYFTVESSTITGNTARSVGGGIFAGHRAGFTLESEFSTIAGNAAQQSGGGLYVEGTGVRLLGVIIADNVHGSAPDCAANQPGSLVTYSLISNTTGCDNMLVGGMNNITGVPANLEPLADNGGPTLTMAPAAGSPAIDNGGGACPALDQRGASRPQGAACDIGSVELAVALQVTIDVRPGSTENPISLMSQGTVPVAIISAPDFDAADVDVSSIRIAGADVALRPNGTWHATLVDVNGDGLLDLVVHVRVQDLALTPATTSLTLTAVLVGGGQIEGTDTIRIVP